MSLTQEAVLSFLLERGGKAKNSELVNSFRSQINSSDTAEQRHNRELFKRLVNSVAVVKQLDEVKFVVVKKRYRDFVRDAAHGGSPETQTDESVSSRSASFAHTSPHRADAAWMMRADMDNNNLCCAINANDTCDAQQTRGENTRAFSMDAGVDAATVKVLNITGDRTSRARKSGAVFAVIAVKSPPRESAPATQNGLRSHVDLHENTGKPMAVGSKVSAPTVPSLNLTFPACKRDELISGTLTGKLRQTGFPQARPPNKPTRQTDDSKYCESVPLEPLAHEWLVKCAAGLWGQIYALLMLDTRLAHRKDFMSGFTALHWAAKGGNSEMMHALMDVAKNTGGAYVNVNSKAHGGYTPLHIAAIHGHTEVMVVLVRVYGADVHLRDNDGKKAFHYLGSGASAEVRALLRGLQESEYVEKTDGESRDPPKGFNTISKLFQPHIGRKQKASTRLALD
ncbi:ankyrin repeat domain-containing protein SOWAHA [Betta splendens]|uniref:Ankyrin repeat domain-containing protein SOWAHA n=1 Tax=Betta splendens TaxID=158456 RepID=A0A6P7NW90_BETSP|nr:ankyrin repeat domain-containing protein SOWAHA [Betta splendens]